MAKTIKEESTDFNKVKYIYKKDSETGEDYAVLNPEYQKYIQGKKFEFYLKYSGIPKDYWNITIDSIQIPSDLIDKAKNFLANIKEKKTSLYLWSDDNTTGKTSLACAIGQELIRQGMPCYFGLAKDVIDVLMKTSGFQSEKWNEESFEIKRKIFNAEVIIIDDIFDPKKSLFWNSNSNNLIISEWDALLRHSTSESKKIILTSNKNIDDVSKNFGRDISNVLLRNFEFIEFKESVLDVRKEQI